jgi:hypothetical protein
MSSDSSNSSVSSLRLAMTAGAITGCLMLFSSMLPFAQVINLCVFCGGIYYGIRIYRNNSKSNHYGLLFWAGVRTAFFSSVIIAFAVYVMAKAVNPSVLEAYLTAAEQMLTSSELPKPTVSLTMERFRDIFTPEFLSLIVVMTYTFIGVLAALICALFHVQSDVAPHS